LLVQHVLATAAYARMMPVFCMCRLTISFAAFVQVVFLHPKDNDGVLMELEEVGTGPSS
jgi:hypothetical protein